MPNSTWNVGFHLRSPRAWMNDPNGCCQFRGVYHFFYQYDHGWPEIDQKAWGEFSSTDLIHWTYDGMPLEPSCQDDKHGVFTGTSYVEKGTASDGGDRLRVYYTGNVVCPAPDHNYKDFDFVYAGRHTNVLTCESEDGTTFSGKRVVISAEKYPDMCSMHVRDPKVWKEDGRLHMLLGARHIDNHGMVLVYDSTDGYTWTFSHTINPKYFFGYVWECPNIVQIDGNEYLAVNPQGLPSLYDRWQNMWQSGYFPLQGRILETREVDERQFVEWDHGHDFYAPQTFLDEQGRWILVGWLGTFDGNYSATPDNLAWWHCLTVPREITRDEETGLLKQNPVPELRQLRGTQCVLRSHEPLDIEGRLADVTLEQIASAVGTLTLDDSFQISYVQGRLAINYLDPRHAAGRTDRFIRLQRLTSLRVLVDGSVVEVYANGGEEVFSCRWFPDEKPNLTVETTLHAARSFAYPMQDAMAEMYANARTPDIKMPGWNEELQLA